MRPSVIAFDVNETLSDLSPLGARFVEVGASASAAPLWFASVLRDGFALTAAGDEPAVRGVAREQLLSQLAEAQLNRSVEEAAQHVMDGFAQPRAAPRRGQRASTGCTRTASGWSRSATASASVAERLLTSAGVRDRFERAALASRTPAPGSRPPGPTSTPPQECDVKPEEMVLVAVHPWDVDGPSARGPPDRLGEPVRGAVPRDLPAADVHREQARGARRALGADAATV